MTTISINHGKQPLRRFARLAGLAGLGAAGCTFGAGWAAEEAAEAAGFFAVNGSGLGTGYSLIR